MSGSYFFFNIFSPIIGSTSFYKFHKQVFKTCIWLIISLPFYDIASTFYFRRPLTTAEGNIRNKEGPDDEIKDVIKNIGGSEIFANNGIFPHERNTYLLKQVVN